MSKEDDAKVKAETKGAQTLGPKNGPIGFYPRAAAFSVGQLII